MIFDKLDTISLDPETYILKPVVIKPSKKGRNIVGYSKMKTHGLSSTSAPSTHQYAVFIPNEGYYGNLIENLIYKTTRKKYHYKVAMRVHLYEKDQKTGAPGKELLTQSIIIKLGTTRTLKVNVLDQNIVFPQEGVFVGLEWIGRIDEKTGKYNPFLGLAEPAFLTTNDVGEERTWFKLGGKPWILHKNANHIYGNAMFGLTLID